MTTDQALAEDLHNHPPRCCCVEARETGPTIVTRDDWCPRCPEHGDLLRYSAECPSCHTTGGHPHTEYCQLVDHASQLTHLELNGPIEGPNYAPTSTRHPHVATCTTPGCKTCDSPSGLSYDLLPPCSSPANDHGDGRGCEIDGCPRHGGGEQ